MSRNAGTRNYTLEFGNPGIMKDVAVGKFVNASDGNIAAARLLVDGDGGTCTTDLLFEKDSWLLLDLGAEVAMEELRWRTNDHSLVNLMIYAGVDLGSDNGLSMKACTSWHDRDFHRPDDRPSRLLNDEFRVTCRRSVRYVLVHRPDTRYQTTRNHLCSLRVMVAEGQSWTTVARGEMAPGFGYPPAEIPHTEVAVSFTGRYLRFSAFSYWADYAGLSGFQVLSKTAPKRHLIVNGQHENRSRRPGLLGEWYHGLDFGRMELGSKRIHTLQRQRVYSHQIVEQLSFDGNYIERHGQVVLERPSPETITPLGGAVAVIAISFAATLPMVPEEFELTVHPRHTTGVASLVLSATAVTQDGFKLLVETNETQFAWSNLPLDDVVKGGLQLEWRAKARIPYDGGEMNINEWNRASRFHGYLDVAFGDWYTFTLEADDEAQLEINETMVIQCRGDKIARHSDNIAVCEGRIFLAAGEHAIEVVHIQRYGPTSMNVFWRRDGMAKTLIPSSAVFHRIPKLCLAWLGYESLTLRPCDSADPLQLFDVSSAQLEFLRPFPKRSCVRAIGHKLSFDRCLFGGHEAARQGENVQTDRHSYPYARFSLANGMLQTESRRRAGKLNCSYSKSGTEWWHRLYRCEAEQEMPGPHICVVGPEWPLVGTKSPRAVAEECAAVENQLAAKWHFEEVKTPAPQPVKIWNSTWQAIHHGYMCCVTQPEKTLGWSLRFEYSDPNVCLKYSEGNTCQSSCDGVCDEPDYDTVDPFAHVNCPAGSDTFDCDPEARLRVCARYCEARSNCGGFMVRRDHLQDGPVCYFFTMNLEAAGERAHYSTDFDLYQKLPVARGSQALSSPRPATCEDVKEERTCVVVDGCEWAPEPGQPDAAPDCSDRNTYPLGKEPYSCATYLLEGDCLDNPAVGAVCAQTCNRTEFCAGLRYSCQTRVEEATTTTPPQATVCPVASNATAVHNKCVCDTGESCSGTACLLSTAGNKRSKLAFFIPEDCPDCVCQPEALGASEAPASSTQPTTTASPDTDKADSEGSQDGQAATPVSDGVADASLPGELWIGLAGLFLLLVVCIVHRRTLRSHDTTGDLPSPFSPAGSQRRPSSSKSSIAPLVPHVYESSFSTPMELPPAVQPLGASRSFHFSSPVSAIPESSTDSTRLRRGLSIDSSPSSVAASDAGSWTSDLPSADAEPTAAEVPSVFYAPGTDRKLSGHSV